MKNLERIQNEIISILLLILTLIFTSSDLSSESIRERQSMAEIMPIYQVIYQ